MGYSLDKNCYQFFHQNGFIEFKNLLSSKQVHSLKECINQKQLSSSKVWDKKGRDLWRSHPSVKSISLNKNLAEVASSLSKKHPIRFGYDQFISGAIPSKAQNLIEASSIRKVACGLIIQLEEKDPTCSLSPNHAGDGIFFSPFHPFVLPQKCALFLIVYALKSTLYTLEERDPNHFFLKELDYCYGDTLKNPTHPILSKIY